MSTRKSAVIKTIDTLSKEEAYQTKREKKRLTLLKQNAKIRKQEVKNGDHRLDLFKLFI